MFKKKEEPTERIDGKVIAKRIYVGCRTMTTMADTYYYLTLELYNGERHEFACSSTMYGLVIEGDRIAATIKKDKISDYKRL